MMTVNTPIKTTPKTALKKSATRIIAAAAVCLALLSAGSLFAAHAPDSKYEKKDVYAQLAKAPKKAKKRPNPLENDPDAIVAGGKLFDEHCVECHGEMAEGGKKGPSLRAPEVQQATPGTLFWLLTNGVVRRGMPVWSKLPEPQRWQLVRYIKSLTPAQPNAASAVKP
jgi:mono/diheme cytochrome c family protein